MRRSLKLAAVGLLILTAAAFGIPTFKGTVNGVFERGIAYTDEALRRKLVHENPVDPAPGAQLSSKRTFIYVLGGRPDRLSHRFRKASILYKQGLSRKILILSRPGITEYSPSLGRNLTNNEWAVRELVKFDVEKGDIEIVRIPEGFFGTLSESGQVPDLVRKMGGNRLILVTSAFHTLRVSRAFSRSPTHGHIELHVYGSDDEADLKDLIYEYVKYILYDTFILPIRNAI